MVPKLKSENKLNENDVEVKVIVSATMAYLSQVTLR